MLYDGIVAVYMGWSQTTFLRTGLERTEEQEIGLSGRSLFQVTEEQIECYFVELNSKLKRTQVGQCAC